MSSGKLFQSWALDSLLGGITRRLFGCYYYYYIYYWIPSFNTGVVKRVATKTNK